MPLRFMIDVAGMIRGTPALSVLIFHRVLARPDPLLPSEPDARRFTAEMRWICAWFNVLSLDEAAARLRAGRLPPRALAITFDDGYADNYDVALPILTRLGISATFFVATGYSRNGRMFNDTVIEAIRVAPSQIDCADLGLGRLALDSDDARVRAIENILGHWKYLPQSERERRVQVLAERVGLSRHSDLMMNDAQIQGLRKAGMSIGAHTVTHPILLGIANEDAEREIAQSKVHLESLLAEPVKLFAYPNGKPNIDYGRSHVDMVRALGFEAAVSTSPGVSDQQSDPLQIARFTPWDRSKLRYAARLARNISSTQAVYA